MSDNVEALYQEIILDHYKHPRGAGLLDNAAGESFQVNPTCGDEVTVGVRLDENDTCTLDMKVRVAPSRRRVRA